MGSLTAGVGAEAPRSAVRREIEGAEAACALARTCHLGGGSGHGGGRYHTFVPCNGISVRPLLCRGGGRYHPSLCCAILPPVADVRDFIYLDVERIRSFVAQGRGGVPTERSDAHEHQAGGQAEASGGIPLFAKVGGQADYHYVRSATETRSVQDAIFEEFVTACPPREYSDDPSWSSSTSLLPDGQLISVRGYVKLIDYQASLEALRAFPKILPAFERFSKATSMSTAPSGGKQGFVSNGMPSKSQLDVLAPIIDGMSKLAGANFGEFVRIKVVPDLARPKEAFVGDGHRDYFRYPSTILTTLYPGGLAAGWVCVGIVHRPSGESLLASQTQQTMGDMLEYLLDQMGDLAAFRQAARPPEVALTPLAIYRLLVHG